MEGRCLLLQYKSAREGAGGKNCSVVKIRKLESWAEIKIRSSDPKSSALSSMQVHVNDNRYSDRLNFSERIKIIFYTLYFKQHIFLYNFISQLKKLATCFVFNFALHFSVLLVRSSRLLRLLHGTRNHFNS